MNNKYLLFLFLFLPVYLMAQSGKQRKADRLYEDFAYVKAIEVYKELVEQNYNVIHNRTRIANSYYKLRDPQNAVTYYEAVVDQPEISPEVYYKYAQMLRGMRQYEESRKWLQKYQDEAKNPKKVAELLDSEAIQLYEGPETYRVRPADLNSEYSDFGTFLSDGKVFFVSARGEADTKTKIYNWTGEPFLDIYKENGTGGPVAAVPGDINTVRHEGPLTLSSDGKTMYFTRNNYFNKRNGKEDEQGVNHLKIYKAVWEEDEWEDIKELPFNNDTYSNGHPSLSSDGTTLYFVSDAPDGFGGSDLYKVSITEGKYGEPKNLGPAINTPGNELFPYIADNGNLYFSSDGHKGYGLLDIFVVTPDEPEKIKNLGKPLNSNMDDFAFSLSSGATGYISSNREGGLGGDDIYEMTILGPLVLKGQVIDSINGNPIPEASIRILDEEGEQIAYLETDENGNFQTSIGRDGVYPIEAKHIEYHTRNVEVNTAEMDNKEVLEYNFLLSPIRDVEYLAEINKIYFDFDKSNIRPDAAKELDKLVDLMINEYPELVIEINSHTDKRGTEKYNRKLAERRAQSTYDYLVEHGVDRERIKTYKGFGESRPDIDCLTCNEEQHQLNRRSVFKVVKMK